MPVFSITEFPSWFESTLILKGSGLYQCLTQCLHPYKFLISSCCLTFRLPKRGGSRLFPMKTLPLNIPFNMFPLLLLTWFLSFFLACKCLRWLGGWYQMDCHLTPHTGIIIAPPPHRTATWGPGRNSPGWVPPLLRLPDSRGLTGLPFLSASKKQEGRWKEVCYCLSPCHQIYSACLLISQRRGDEKGPSALPGLSCLCQNCFFSLQSIRSFLTAVN